MHSYYFVNSLYHSPSSGKQTLKEIQNEWNANDYFIPQHRIELVKKLPLYTFPATWNTETDEKFNPSQKAYLKNQKSRLLVNVNR